MAEIARKTRRYPSDLTDAEWEWVAPLMPKPAPRGRKPAVNFREVGCRLVGRQVGVPLRMDQQGRHRDFRRLI